MSFWPRKKTRIYPFLERQKIDSSQVHRHSLVQHYWVSICKLLVDQGLKYLVELQGSYYHDLILTFYYNFKYKNRVTFTKVIGIDIILDNDIWTNVAHLLVQKDAINVQIRLEGFNRVLAFRSFLKNPQQLINMQFLVGGLKMDERLIHYLIVWIICPRASNHTQCSEANLLIIHGPLNHVTIYWLVHSNSWHNA